MQGQGLGAGPAAPTTQSPGAARGVREHQGLHLDPATLAADRKPPPGIAPLPCLQARWLQHAYPAIPGVVQEQGIEVPPVDQQPLAARVLPLPRRPQPFPQYNWTRWTRG
jgi:hypothetical protein